MDNINNFIKANPKYTKLQKPLEAAHICDAARKVARDRFGVISFREGLLSLSVTSSAQATDLQMQNGVIIKEINEELKSDIIKKLRFKVT